MGTFWHIGIHGDFDHAIATTMYEASVVSDSFWHYGHYGPPSSSCPRDFPGMNTEVVAVLPRDLPDPGIRPTSPVSLHWQESSLPLSHLGPKTHRLDSLKYFHHLVASRTLRKQPETLILLDLSHFINLQKWPHLMALEEREVLKPPSQEGGFRKTLPQTCHRLAASWRSHFTPSHHCWRPPGAGLRCSGDRAILSSHWSPWALSTLLQALIHSSCPGHPGYWMNCCKTFPSPLKENQK